LQYVQDINEQIHRQAASGHAKMKQLTVTESKRPHRQHASNAALMTASHSVSKGNNPGLLNRDGSVSRSDVMKPLSQERSRADVKSGYKSLSLSPSQSNKHPQRSGSPSPVQHVIARNIVDSKDPKQQWSRTQTTVVKNTVSSTTYQRNSSSERIEKNQEKVSVSKLALQSSLPFSSAGNRQSRNTATNKHQSQPATVLAPTNVSDIAESTTVLASSSYVEHCQDESVSKYQLLSSDVSSNNRPKNVLQHLRYEEHNYIPTSVGNAVMEQSPVNATSTEISNRKLNVLAVQNKPAGPDGTVKTKRLESSDMHSDTLLDGKGTANIKPQILQQEDQTNLRSEMKQILMPNENVSEGKSKNEIQKFNTPYKHTFENCATCERKVVNVNTTENCIASDEKPMNVSNETVSKTAVVRPISSDLLSVKANENDTTLLGELQGGSRQQQHWSAQHSPKLTDKKRVSSICMNSCWQFW